MIIIFVHLIGTNSQLKILEIVKNKILDGLMRTVDNHII